MTDKKDRKPDLNRVNKDYDSWVRKIRAFQNNFYFCISFFSLITLLVLFNQNFPNKGICIGLLFLIFVKSTTILVGRSGHKEGYFDGYNDGYEQGRDDALGIDNETRHFIDEVQNE